MKYALRKPALNWVDTPNVAACAEYGGFVYSITQLTSATLGTKPMWLLLKGTKELGQYETRKQAQNRVVIEITQHDLQLKWSELTSRKCYSHFFRNEAFLYQRGVSWEAEINGFSLMGDVGIRKFIDRVAAGKAVEHEVKLACADELV